MQYMSLEENIIGLLKRREDERLSRTELLPLLRHKANAKQMHATLDKMIAEGVLQGFETETKVERVITVPSVRLTEARGRAAESPAGPGSPEAISRKVKDAAIREGLLS